MQQLVELGYVVNTEKSQLDTGNILSGVVPVFGAIHSLPLWGEGEKLQVVPHGFPIAFLGLMASAILVVCLGHLHMREFQCWVASLRLDPVRHGGRRAMVMTLRYW